MLVLGVMSFSSMASETLQWVKESDLAVSVGKCSLGRIWPRLHKRVRSTFFVGRVYLNTSHARIHIAINSQSILHT